MDYRGRWESTEVKEWSYYDCRKSMDGCIQQKGDVDYVVNLTGGNKLMALAAYEDRYVIPTNHREYAGKTPFDNEIAFNHRSSCGFSFGNGCSDGTSKVSLFGNPTHKNTMSGKGHDQ